MPPSLELACSVAATQQAVEEFCVELRDWAEVNLDRRHTFAVELLAREALRNAVVHGCHSDPCKRVRCWLRLKRRLLFIAVADDGAGFDWRAASQKAPRRVGTSGRGIQILRRYATRVRYNTAGNMIAMMRRL